MFMVYGCSPLQVVYLCRDRQPCANWACEGSKTEGMRTVKGYSEEDCAPGLIHVYVNLLTAGWKNNLAERERERENGK